MNFLLYLVFKPISSILVPLVLRRSSKDVHAVPVMEPPRWEPSYHASEAMALQDTKPSSSSSELVRSFIEKIERSIDGRLPLRGSKSVRKSLPDRAHLGVSKRRTPL
jgi:hypothetical protein